MTQQALEALSDTLAAIPADKVRPPNIPAMETVVEALQTVELVRQDALVAGQLGKVGVGEAELEAVELAAQACSRAEILCRYALFGVTSDEAQATMRRGWPWPSRVWSATTPSSCATTAARGWSRPSTGGGPWPRPPSPGNWIRLTP